jgi:hypothetical protein
MVIGRVVRCRRIRLARLSGRTSSEGEPLSVVWVGEAKEKAIVSMKTLEERFGWMRIH